MTDSEIRRLRESLNSADTRRAELEREFEKHASSIREIQQRRESLNSERVEFEKHIAENRTYLERAERNLKHAQNQKEYESAMRETDALQKQITAFETKLIENMSAVDEVEKEIAERSDEINTIDSKRAAALSEFDAEVERDRAALAEEEARRADVFGTLPDRLAAVYNRLAQRGRDGVAVAEVVNGSCSACFMALRPQMLVEVRRGEQIVTCESCTRILYIAADTKAAASESKV
jgi:predicted  nucleic acid-binding Zn-ribbon protein